MNGCPRNIHIFDRSSRCSFQDRTQHVQEFTTLLHGIKQCFNINDDRCHLFWKTSYVKKDKEHFITKIKGIDSSLISPCWISLKQNKIERSYKKFNMASCNRCMLRLSQSWRLWLVFEWQVETYMIWKRSYTLITI